MKKRLVLSIILLLTSCVTSTPRSNSLILEYSDFGPQVIASKIIGMEWWQWNNHGESRPRDYNIKVVVYNDVSLKDIEEKYPINANKDIDYRYVAYRDAIAYLDEKIKENVMQVVTEELKDTKNKIVLEFGVEN